jgi:putative transposase
MQLRCAFRIEPSPGQCIALGRTSDCARVIFDGRLRARREAHRAGLPYPTSARLSKKFITDAKKALAAAAGGEG